MHQWQRPLFPEFVGIGFLQLQIRVKNESCGYLNRGGMAEWLKATVLKTIGLILRLRLNAAGD